MSLPVKLNTTKELVVRPAETITTDTLVIERIVDIPEEKSVFVFIRGLGRVKVAALSDAKYDAPQWTNESLAAAVAAQF
jgi:hypothetical protein